MSLNFQTERVLIWGKTYPELSTTYAETVCTAGVRQDGSPVRLYPVPLRYIESGYILYDWIEAPICKSARDSRPESFKIDAQRIKTVAKIPPDDSGWAGRSEFVFKDTSWQFENVGELKAKQKESGRSLGIVTPGSIEGVNIEYKAKDDEKRHADKMKAIQDQTSFFLDEFKELAFRPFDVKLRWRCAGGCPECSKDPHDMKVLDWGLLELARKNQWDPVPAKTRLEDLAGSGRYDFKLFLGNLKKHRAAFLPVAIWYPKRQLQTRLL
jgi:hypothetical protein